jgi:hypothetical protein
MVARNSRKTKKSIDVSKITYNPKQRIVGGIVLYIYY